MTLAISNNSKNSLLITNEGKTGQDTTWADAELTWAETGPAGDTWAVPGTPFRKEAKNTLNISNESKT